MLTESSCCDTEMRCVSNEVAITKDEYLWGFMTYPNQICNFIFYLTSIQHVKHVYIFELEFIDNRSYGATCFIWNTARWRMFIKYEINSTVSQCLKFLCRSDASHVALDINFRVVRLELTTTRPPALYSNHLNYTLLVPVRGTILWNQSQQETLLRLKCFYQSYHPYPPLLSFFSSSSGMNFDRSMSGTMVLTSSPSVTTL